MGRSAVGLVGSCRSLKNTPVVVANGHWSQYHNNDIEQLYDVHNAVTTRPATSEMYATNKDQDTETLMYVGWCKNNCWRARCFVAVLSHCCCSEREKN